MKKISILALLLVGILIIGSGCSTFLGGNASISGKLNVPLIDNSKWSISVVEGPIKRSTTTDSSGNFILRGLNEGTYKIRFVNGIIDVTRTVTITDGEKHVMSATELLLSI